MILTINLTHEEKCELLRGAGYMVGVETHTNAYSAYHNDVDFSDVEVFSVRSMLTGEPALKPPQRNLGQNDWLDYAVKQLIETRLKMLLLQR